MKELRGSTRSRRSKENTKFICVDFISSWMTQVWITKTHFTKGNGGSRFACLNIGQVSVGFINRHDQRALLRSLKQLQVGTAAATYNKEKNSALRLCMIDAKLWYAAAATTTATAAKVVCVFANSISRLLLLLPPVCSKMEKFCVW